MLTRWLWWAPLAVLIAGAGLVGLRLGFFAQTVTETDVINTYAADYVERTAPQGRLTDCFARPATGVAGAWLIISCRAPQGGWDGYDYIANRLGGLEQTRRVPAVNPMAPEA